MPHKPNHPVARRAPKNGLDDFPTPPWATRALFEYVVPEFLRESDYIFLEPACGRGHMARTLKEYVQLVKASDVKDYKRGFAVKDYLNGSFGAYDVLCTNPPYKAANEFVERGLSEARRGVCILARTLWIEGGKEVPTSRWHRILQHSPPARIGIFTARMPARKGKVVRKYPVFMSHSWFYWDTRNPAKHGDTRFIFIPPEAQRLLEKDEDYA